MGSTALVSYQSMFLTKGKIVLGSGRSFIFYNFLMLHIFWYTLVVNAVLIKLLKCQARRKAGIADCERADLSDLLQV